MDKLLRLGIMASIVPLATGSLPAYAAENGNELETVHVTGKAVKVKQKDKAFIKTGATSGRDDIINSTQSLDDIVRSVPGAFTQIDKSQGTLSVNIRGATGFGRVNTMIDGVSQTFYGSSTDGGGRGGGTSQFGALIDPAFLSSMNAERGTFSGAGGVNSLMGAVNFNTIGVDDVVGPDKKIGVLAKYGQGSNAVGPNYMGAIGARFKLGSSAWIGAIYAASRRHISQDYKIGGGRNVAESSIRLPDKDPDGFVYDQDDYDQTDTTPYNPDHLKQKPLSRMVKLEYGDKYSRLVLSQRNYTAAIAGRSLSHQTRQLNYHFSPDSRFWNMDALYARNQSTQSYKAGSRFTGKTMLADLDTYNNSRVLDLSNTFRFKFGQARLKTTIGWNLLHNNYSKNRQPDEFNIYIDEDDASVTAACDDDLTGRKCQTASVFQPGGGQKFRTFYLDNTLNYKIFNLNYNFNWGKYAFNGESYANLTEYLDQLESDSNLRRNGISYIENARINNQLTSLRENMMAQHCRSSAYYDAHPNTVDDYTYYDTLYNAEGDETEYYCRSVQQTRLNDTGRGRNFNSSIALSARIHDLFVPFVSYARTSRTPNIKEMFFSNIADKGINPNLKPERAKTLQFGFSGFGEDIFSNNDKLGFKILAYRTRTENYIYNIAEWYRYGPILRHINRDKPVTGKGLEAEFSYDSGRFYANLAYALQKSDQPPSYTDASTTVKDHGFVGDKNMQGFGASKISILPKQYLSLDIGGRFFNQKLTLGGIAKFYGKSERANPKLKRDIPPGADPRTYRGLNYIREKQDIPRQPVIFDFYASYEPVKNLIVKGSIQNAFDRRYIDPLDSNNDSASQSVYLLGEFGGKEMSVLNNYARGRTYLFNISYKF